MNKKNKILFLYTVDFPFGSSEPYLLNELPVIANNFKEVVIIAAYDEGINHVLPQNVKAYRLNDLKAVTKRKKLILSNFQLVVKLICKEYLACNAKSFFLKNIRKFASELINAFEIGDVILRLRNTYVENAVHYSFWMNSFPLALSILKEKDFKDPYVFRVHGYDLYKERWEMNYIPFRELTYKNASSVYAVSEMGLQYIQKNYTYSEKAKKSYLGTREQGISPFEVKSRIIVSCSGIIKLKRLHLIVDALKTIDYNIEWYHFGEGSGEVKTELLNKINELPLNIKVNLIGQVTQEQLFNFYRTNSVSLFINVSETEGLPVSIMEAISMGIPVLATNVGGTSEIVNDSTGILVKSDINYQDLKTEIDKFFKSEKNSSVFRNSVKQFWELNFNAERNYALFCETLLNL